MEVDFGDLPLVDLKKLDAICNRFEQAWRGGGRPVIEDFLKMMDEPARSKLSRELVLVDLECRRAVGEVPMRSEYASRFPGLAAFLDALWADAHGATVDQPVHADQHSDDAMRNETSSLDLDFQQSPVPDDPHLGKTLGNLELVSRLGAGGMGAVYRARHQLIECERAVKVMRPGLSSNPAAVKRFLREAQTAIASLEHPNIVKAFDVGLGGEEIYLVMELVNGEDLAHSVRRAGPMTPVRAAGLIEQAARGLACAHAAGFVHRDIKPHNLIVSSDGVLKILDLGLVRLLEDSDEPTDASADGRQEMNRSDQTTWAGRLTDGRTILGTLHYMAPEQARSSQQADARSDIYSLGCTLYFLLTGREAFAGRDPEEILLKHQQGKFAPPRQLRPDLPPALEAIVLKMMSLHPEDRYATAAQSAAALNTWRALEALDQPFALTEPVRFQSMEELRQVLTRLKVVDDTEWKVIQMQLLHKLTNSRARAEWSRTSATTMLRLTMGPGPESVEELEVFKELCQNSESLGNLTKHQMRVITAGNVDLLRMPQHVVRERVGNGWKGEIYLARHVQSGSLEAVRTFSPGAFHGLGENHAGRLPQFMDYCSKLAAIDHPLFPRVRSFEIYRNRLHPQLAYLATERLDAVSLAEFMSSAKWNSDSARTDWALASILAVTRGLAVAHQQGIWHLDIHAKSLMIDPQRNIRLVDLGIAAPLLPRKQPVLLPRSAAGADMSRASAPPKPQAPGELQAGTLACMPPEQWLDRSNTSPAVDIYNLGCALCFLLTGEYPYSAATLEPLMKQHLKLAAGKSPAVRKTPESLRPLIEKMLAKQPEKRFGSMTELEVALKEVSHKLPVRQSWMTKFKRGLGMR
jgi:serine/threonine protein kinase